jgi:hypothetical protein
MSLDLRAILDRAKREARHKPCFMYSQWAVDSLKALGAWPPAGCRCPNKECDR